VTQLHRAFVKFKSPVFFAKPFSRKRILAQILKHGSLAQLSPTLLKCLFMGWGKGGGGSYAGPLMRTQPSQGINLLGLPTDHSEQVGRRRQIILSTNRLFDGQIILSTVLMGRSFCQPSTISGNISQNSIYANGY